MLRLAASRLRRAAGHRGLSCSAAAAADLPVWLRRHSSLALAQEEEEPAPASASAGAASVPLAGPLDLYERGVASGKYRADERQKVAIAKLQRVWTDLGGGDADGTSSGLTMVGAMDGGGVSWNLWRSIVNRKERQDPQPGVRGLYLWGGVGSGKTMARATTPLTTISSADSRPS